MGISTAPGTMTSAEIAALSKQHTIFSWSVQSAVDPIAIDHAEGVYLYTPEGRPDPRLQQPADVGQHRPRRPAGHRCDHRPGAQAPVRPAGVRDRDPGAPRRQARRDPARRHGQGLLHARWRRGDRERDQVRPPRDRPLQGPGALPRLSRRDARGDDADRRPAPLGQRARPRRRRPLPGHAPLGRGGTASRGREPPGPRGRHPLRGRRRRSPRSSSRPSSAPTASSSRPTATSPASARSATGTAS